MIGVIVTFKYDEDFDRARLISIAENERATFEGMPGLRSKFFTVDDTGRRAMNFYVWESADAAKSFFSEEVREMVTGLYGVEPTSPSRRSLRWSTTPPRRTEHDRKRQARLPDPTSLLPGTRSTVSLA